MKLKLSGSMPLMALATAFVLMAAVACGDNDNDDEDGRAAQEPTPPTTTPPTAAPSTPAPQLSTPTPATATVPSEIETEARKLLASELGAGEADFTLVSSEGVQWSDASLGCPQEGYAYAQVLTPGHKLVFDLGGTSHAVHANSDGSHMVLCGDGQ